MTSPDLDLPPWRRWSSLVGCFLAFLPNGLALYWGNLSVYIFSYIYVMRRVDPLQNQGLWLIPLYIMSRNLGVTFAGRVMRFLGRRLSMWLAIGMFNSGIAICYWAAGYSVWGLNTSLGVLTGLGNGILHAVIMVYVIDWSGNQVGLISSAVMTGYSVGSALANQLITLYVNPTNQEVDLETGTTTYFSQPNLLRRVPTLLLLLTAFSLSFHLLGSLLIRQAGKDPPSVIRHALLRFIRFVSTRCTFEHSTRHRKGLSPFMFHRMDNDNHEEEEQLERFLPYDEAGLEMAGYTISKETSLSPECPRHQRSYSILHELSMYTSTMESLGDQKTKPAGVNEPEAENLENSRQDRHEMELQVAREVEIPSAVVMASQHAREYHIVELFRRREFYILLALMLTTNMVSLTFTPYYKAFGQRWIEDDHFLTNLGTGLLCATTTTRLLWGFVVDRFGFKIPTLLTLTTLAVVSALYFFTPSRGEFLFAICTLLFGCANSAVFTCSHTGTIQLLGKTHFTTNYGILSMCTIALTLVVPPIIEQVLNQIGWLPLFLCTSLISLASLLPVLILMPVPDG